MRYFLSAIMSALVWLTPVQAGETFKIPDCSLLFVQHSNDVVECYTDSTYSHVAVLVYHDGKPYVYEAHPPKIQRYTLSEWLNMNGRFNEGRSEKARISILAPKVEYSSSELEEKKTYLEKQVGRRYSLRGYLTHKRGDGIHCSEMTAEMLGITEPHTVSPGALRLKVVHTHKKIGKTFYVRIKPEHRRTWCQRQKDEWNSRGRWCSWSWAEMRKWTW